MGEARDDSMIADICPLINLQGSLNALNKFTIRFSKDQKIGK